MKTHEKPQKPIRGIDWCAIFEKRPDLNPPGYESIKAYFQLSRINSNPEKEKSNDTL